MGFTNGTGPDSCDTNPSTCMVGYDPGLLIPYVSMALFGTSPYVKTTVGLMQIRQISLNDVNRSYNLSVPEYRQSDLYDPNANIFIGTSNLANHIRYANGDVWQGIRTAGDGTDAYVNRIKKCAGQ